MFTIFSTAKSPETAGRGVMHPLLRHEAAVARAELALALPGWRDWLVLAAMLGLALAALIGSAATAPLRDPWVVAIVGVAAAWVALRAGRRRLAWLAAESALAAAALDPQGRRLYALMLLAALAALTGALGGLAGGATLPWMAAGAVAGATAAALLPLLPAWSWRIGAARSARPRRVTASDAVASLQWIGADPAARIALLLGAALATLAAALAPPPGWSVALRLALPAAVSALCMLRFARVDPESVRFLARHGYGAWRSAALHLRVSALYAAATLPLLMLAGAHMWPSLLSCAGVILAIGVFAVLRVWSLRVYSARIADLVLTLGAAAIGIVALAFPPLIAPVLLIAAAALYRRAARSDWLLA